MTHEISRNLSFILLISALLLLCVRVSESAIRKRQIQNTNEHICGISGKSTGLIVDGSLLNRGRFPWLVALMYVKSQPPIFFCGGSLISDKHVVTGELLKR